MACWWRFVALLPLLLWSQVWADTGCISRSLDGQWQMSVQPEAQTPKALGKSGWQDITVPANWYLEQPWLAGKVWYRYLFDTSKTDDTCLSSLRFNGVDYDTTVWLNGQKLGSHQGYFAPFQFNASDTLRDGANELLVLVDSPLESSQSWSLRKTTIKGVLAHHDTRPGGAWSTRGQERNTGGIWNSVWLDRAPLLRIEPMQLSAAADEKLHRWSFSVESKIARIEGQNITRAELKLSPINGAGGQTFTIQTDNPVVAGSRLKLQSTIENPELWYPRGYGTQALYQVELSLYDNQKLLGSAESEFGFRKVDFQQENEVFLINNRAFFVRGTNYISDQMLSTMDTASYARDLELMQLANINAVRVHAHIERREFYTQADRLGMLVWQDFPLQWGYSDSDEFRRQAVTQLGEMVEMLGRHPSVVNWTLQNEPPFDAFWMKWKYPDYNPDQNRLLVDELRQSLDVLDQSRWSLNYSATKTHPWLGWYSGSWRDYARPARSRWVTEFGAQALPGLSSLKKIFFEQDLWPDNDHKMEIWKYRNFQPKETFEIAGVSMGDNVETLIYNTQSYQSKITGFAARSLRRQKYAGVNGIFQFMFVENWPSVNWGVVDYWRELKPGYHALAQAYQPVMPMIDWRDVSYSLDAQPDFAIWLLNDYWSAYEGATLTMEFSKNGIVSHRKSETVDLAADSAKMLFRYQPVLVATGTYNLKLQLHSANGLLLGTDEHDFTVTGVSQLAANE